MIDDKEKLIEILKIIGEEKIQKEKPFIKNREILAVNLGLLVAKKGLEKVLIREKMEGKIVCTYFIESDRLIKQIRKREIDLGLDNLIEIAEELDVDLGNLFDPNYRFQCEISKPSHSCCS